MATKSLFTNRMETMQVPIFYPPADWRYVALDMEASTDEELIERAYWQQLRKYGPLARTDADAARHLALINDAYRSLCPHTFEPWILRESVPASAQHENNREHTIDAILVYLLLLCMVVTSVLVLSESVRAQTDAIVRSLIGLAHNL